MIARISPGQLHGELTVPPSKSWMQRVCAAALLHNGETIIKNHGQSADDKAALSIIQSLGTEVMQTADAIYIKSDGFVKPAAPHICCGESGLSARLFLPITGLSDQEVTITGKGSLLRRPMGGALDVLPQLGINVRSNNGYLPVTLKGPLAPANIEVDGSLSSQFLSGLLFALSAVANAPVTVYVQNLVSKPYIDMTLEVLRLFGHRISHQGYEQFLINLKTNPKQNIEVTIPSDWSSGAYWLVGAAINGQHVKLHGLRQNTYQADELVIGILQQVGANMSIEGQAISISKSALKAFEADLTDAPDLFPILSVLAACCQGISRITGLNRLTHKESDRAKSIQAMLAILGVSHQIKENQLLIEGRPYLESGTINGFNDHRIVMAAAIASLRVNGEITITEAEAVAKSYPSFFTEAASLGMNCVLSS